MKQGQCVCPLSWCVHCNFTGDGKCVMKGGGRAPPTLTSLGKFYMMECTPESSSCYSVYSVINPFP